MELLKLLSTNEIVAQILSFLILLILLRVFAWKPILKLLDERKERIASEFKRIEEAKATVEKVKAEYEEKLKAIDETARLKMEEALLESQRITEELRNSGRKEAEKIIADAKTDIKYELAKAKEGLKDEITDLVLDATGRLLEEKITAEEDRRVVKDFLDRIGQINGNKDNH